MKMKLEKAKLSVLTASLLLVMLGGCSTQTARLESPSSQQDEQMQAGVDTVGRNHDASSEEDMEMLKAAWNGRLMEILVLLDNEGIDPDIRGPNGVTALSLAAQNNHVRVVKALLEHGADPNISDVKAGWFPLMWAAYNGFDKVALLLIEHGADVNQQNRYGETAMIQAAFEGRDDTVRLLLDNGADYSLKNDKGFDAMKAASNKGYFRIVDMLTEAGASLEKSESGDKDA